MAAALGSVRSYMQLTDCCGWCWRLNNKAVGPGVPEDLRSIHCELEKEWFLVPYIHIYVYVYMGGMVAAAVVIGLLI